MGKTVPLVVLDTDDDDTPTVDEHKKRQRELREFVAKGEAKQKPSAIASSEHAETSRVEESGPTAAPEPRQVEFRSANFAAADPRTESRPTPVEAPRSMTVRRSADSEILQHNAVQVEFDGRALASAARDIAKSLNAPKRRRGVVMRADGEVRRRVIAYVDLAVYSRVEDICRATGQDVSSFSAKAIEMIVASLSTKPNE